MHCRQNPTQGVPQGCERSIKIKNEPVPVLLEKTTPTAYRQTKTLLVLYDRVQSITRIFPTLT